MAAPLIAALAGGGGAAGGASSMAGILSGLMGGKGKKEGGSKAPATAPAISSVGANTPNIGKPAGGKLFDSNAAAGSDPVAILAMLLQDAVGPAITEPVGTGTVLAPTAPAPAPVGQGTVLAPPTRAAAPAKADKPAKGGKGGGDYMNMALRAVGTKLLEKKPAPKPSTAPRIGTIAENTPQISSFAEGGVAAPGEPFITGEAGGSPELVTPVPTGGNVITPLTGAEQAPRGPQAQPQAQTQAAPAAQPAAQQGTAQPEVAGGGGGGIGGQMGELGMDFAIASIMGDPSMLINLQQNRAQHRKFLAAKALENPQLLADSPEAAQAYESIFGEGSALALLKSNAPGAMYIRQGLSMGLNIVPPGTVMANGNPAPSIVEQMNAFGFEGGFGFRMGPDGFQLSRATPSHTEIGTAISYSTWATLTQAYEATGMGSLQASKAAAELVLAELSQVGVVVPPKLRDLAMSDITSDMDAKHQAATKEAVSTVELAFKDQMAEAESRGREIGEVRGEAAVGAMDMEIVKPDGTVIRIPLPKAKEYFDRTTALAEAISGVKDAVDLGTNPSKTLLNQMALSGMDVIEDESGNMMGLPVGHDFGGKSVPAGALAAGPESMARLKEIVRILDKVESIPNVLDAFPSEKVMGRVQARIAARGKSYVRELIDSPELLTGRGAVRRMGFHMARLAGSNSQLSDAERSDAGWIYKPFREGTGTREQIAFGFKWARDHVDDKIQGIKYPGGQVGPRPGDTAPAGTAPPGFVAPAPAGTIPLTLPDGSTVDARPVN